MAADGPGREDRLPIGPFHAGGEEEPDPIELGPGQVLPFPADLGPERALARILEDLFDAEPDLELVAFLFEARQGDAFERGGDWGSGRAANWRVRPRDRTGVRVSRQALPPDRHRPERGGPRRRRARPRPAAPRRPVKRSYWQAVFAAGAVSALERSASVSTRSSKTSSRNTRRARPRTAMSSGPGRRRPGSGTGRSNRPGNGGRPRTGAHRPPGAFARRSRGTRDASSVHSARERPVGTLGAGPDNLPSMRAASIRAEQAASAVKLARLGRRPDFLAGFLLPSLRPNAWGVEFGLSMPFPAARTEPRPGDRGRR